jgi:hypothetical protein
MKATTLKRHLSVEPPTGQCVSKRGYEHAVKARRVSVSAKANTAEEFRLSHPPAQPFSWRPACFDVIYRFGKRSGRK